MLRRFRHLPAAVLLVMGVASCVPQASAAPWQRRELLASPASVNLQRADLRFLDARGPGDLTLWDGRLVVRAPGLEASALGSIAPAVEARLREVFGPEWEIPFSWREPIRLLLLSSGDQAVSEVFSLVGGASPDREPVIALNVAAQTDSEIAAEAVRDVASFVLRKLAPGADDALVFATARALSLSGGLLESDRAEIREAGASPENSLERRAGEIFGAAWIDEMAAGAGPGFVPSVWKRRVSSGETSFLAFAEGYAEAVRRSPWEAFQRSLERAYSRTEVFGELARLTDQDRSAGALDASRPGAFSWKFFSLDVSSSGGMSVSWPQDAGTAFAVVHYEDSLPSDVVRFSPGDSKVLPLSGVARIDWIVPGGAETAAALAAPVAIGAVADYPVSGLAGRAFAQPGQGVSLEWSALRQQALSGWAIFRSEVDDSGKILKSSPQWLPSSSGEQERVLYSFVDATAAAGRYYRYDVWAVTEDGSLSRSFRTTVRAR